MKFSKRLITALLALMLLSLNITGLAYYTGNTEESVYPVKYQEAINTLYGLGVLADTSLDGYENTVSRTDFATYVTALGGGRTVEIPEPAEQDITLGEAVKMLVDMTENTIRAEYYGSYPTGYLAIASRMGITHGLSGMQAYDKINYGIAVQMLYNSMRITPGVFDTITENYVDYEFDANHTV
ncbi:MAG: hypothetical protein IJ366_01150, partial [Clostridia bacterium]|nr:hypothetical protein [Clostridia bacterium]